MSQSNANEWVTLSVDDGSEARAYIVRPSGAGPHPGMILIMEAVGVNAQIRGVAQRYAEQGYVVIAPDMFHRVEPGFESIAMDWNQLKPLVMSLTTEGFVADMKAAFDWLTSQSDVDGSKIVALGFCLGGRAAYVANSELPLAASVSYYGGGIAQSLLDRAPRLHGPQLFFWGGKDANITPDHTRAVTDALRAAGKSFVNVEFSDANHGFFNETLPERYHPSAARESWAIAVRFLADALGTTREAEA
jgi:carboxymethylenebutenolidase